MRARERERERQRERERDRETERQRVKKRESSILKSVCVCESERERETESEELGIFYGKKGKKLNLSLLFPKIFLGVVASAVFVVLSSPMKMDDSEAPVGPRTYKCFDRIDPF